MFKDYVIDLQNSALNKESNAYVLELPREFIKETSTQDQNLILVYVDNQLLTKSNTQHQEIRLLGDGRYSIWNSQLYFSLPSNLSIFNFRIITVRVFNKQDNSKVIYHYQDQLLNSGIRFPNTWIELDWVDRWNFDNDIFFAEPHFRNTFRRFFLSQVVKMVDKLVVNGDNVEFGVYYGYGSKIILDNSKKNLHLIDSFEGLSNPDASDGNSWESGDMSVPLEVVTQNLKSYVDRIKIHRGWIPDVFEHTEIETIAFAHIDVDLYMPTLKSLEFTSTKLQIGGMIICDDYGFSSCPGATKACEDFIEKNPNFSLLPLPVGGALIFIR